MTLKYCPKCNYPLNAGMDHCAVCGAPVRKRVDHGALGRLVVLAAILVLISQGIYLFLEKGKGKRRLEQERITAQKERERHTRFVENIERHYLILVTLYDGRKLTQARAKLYLFKKYGQLNYKDVRMIERKVLIASLEDRAREIPESDPQSRLEIYARLMELDPENTFYRERYMFYESKLTQTKREVDEER